LQSSRSARRCEIQQAELRPLLDEVSGFIAVQAAVRAPLDVNHNESVPEDEVSDVLGSVSTARLTSSAGRMIGSMTKLLSHTEMADVSTDEDVADFSHQVRELIELVSCLSGEEVPDVDVPVVSPVEDMELTILESSVDVPITRPRRPLGSISRFDLAHRAADSGIAVPSLSTPLVDTVDGLPVEADEDADDEGDEGDWSDVYANDLAYISGFHRLDLSDDEDIDLRTRIFPLDEDIDDSLHEDGLLVRGDLDVLPGWFTDR
jgi:hypothetical protein